MHNIFPSQCGMLRKEKKIDHEGGFQGALLLQSTTKEGEFKADLMSGFT
jgi:hypothetical protein